tara:strand:+ start:269 stop:760 length:492 start_codon:yes stop_codon:yes gene_type:complete
MVKMYITLILFGLFSSSFTLAKTIAEFNTDVGKFNIQFYEKEAPNTSRQIIKLIKNKFYDGLMFHRVISNFVAQTGDPTGTGAGGSGKTITFEKNKLKHKFGEIGLARAGNNLHSGDSQFYICLNTLPHLDGKYVIFAKIIEGQENVKKIKQGTKITKAKVIE